MNEKISFSGEPKLELGQNELQKAIDKYFPTPNKFVRVGNYTEIGNSVLFVIVRNYANNAGCSLGTDFICDKDASLITGLDESAFQPFEPGKSLIAPSIPWNDHMCYVPLSEFCKLWKHQIKTMAGSTVKKITVKPSINSISIEIEF